MKSRFQVLSFLSQYKPNTDLDRDVISAFVAKRYRVTPKTIIFSKEEAEDGTIDASSFLQWYENGFASSEIAEYENRIIILGKCTKDDTKIIGVLDGGEIHVEDEQIPVYAISKASEDDAIRFRSSMLSSGLQFNPNKLKLEPKYFPQQGEKILFHTYDQSTNGVGIVRSIDRENNKVELYCYFIYPTKTENSRLGYSMHERDVVNLQDYIFEPLFDASGNNRFSTEDGTSAYRRMKRELEKEGKTWKDKICRIEPLNMKLDEGDEYHYISDKLVVVTTKDKGTPTGQIRYLCGNYFADHAAAEAVLDSIKETIRNYLASGELPNEK